MKEVGDYVFSDPKIGTGSFAEVYKGYHKTTGRMVAVKVIDVERVSKNNKKLRQHLSSEIAIMQESNHKNIVKLYYVAESKRHIYMVLEFCEGGDFYNYLRKSERLSEDRAKYFMQQLASGLHFLRMKNIIHRDLKPQNLLLSDKSDHPVLKIADFGFARFIGTQSMADTLCGSPLYMAPEILKDKNYTVKADLWSVGIILYELLVGVPPFAAKTPYELMKELETYTVTFPLDRIPISKECLDLIHGLLKKDVNQRISWEEFFLHPWLGLRNQDPVVVPSPLATNHPHPSQVPGSSTSSTSISAPSGHTQAYQPQNPSPGNNFPLISPSPSNNAPVYGYNPTQLPYISPISASPSSSAPIQTFSPFYVAASPLSNAPIHNFGNFPIITSPSTNAPINNFSPIGASPSSGAPIYTFTPSSNMNFYNSGGPSSNYLVPSPPNQNQFPFATSSPPKNDTHGYYTSSSSSQQLSSSAGRHSMSQSTSIGKMKISGAELTQPNIRTPYTNPFKGMDSSSSGSSQSSSPPHTKNSSSSVKRSGGVVNNSDSFEKDCIILDSHTTTTPPPFESDALVPSNESFILSELDMRTKRALAIAELGDFKAESEQFAEALAVYVKALQMMHAALLAARHLVQSQALASSQRLVHALEILRDRYGEYLKKVEYYRSVLRASDTFPCVEKIMYDYAIHMGRMAGVDEMWKNYSKSEQVYHTALLLLETLHHEVTEQQDREILQAYIMAFSKRLAAVRRKATATAT